MHRAARSAWVVVIAITILACGPGATTPTQRDAAIQQPPAAGAGRTLVLLSHVEPVTLSQHRAVR